MAARRRPPVGEWAFGLGAFLLPFAGPGVPLGEVATPDVDGGRLLLGLLFVTGWYLAPSSPPRRDPALRALRWLVAVATVSLLIARPGPTVVPDLVAAAPYASRFPADVEAGLRELLRLGVVLMAAAAAARYPARWALAGAGAGAALRSLLGVREYLLTLRMGDPTWRIFGGFTNPNQLASYLLVALPLLLVAAALATADSRPAQWLADQQVARPELKLRLAALAGAGLVLVALGLTASRGGLLGFATGSAAALAAWARRGERRKVVPLVLLALLLAGACLAAPPLRNRLVGAGQSSSGRHRLLTWQGTVDLARHYPLLGTGLGGWAATYPIFARASYTAHAHSGYLQTWAETGVVGLAVYLAVFAAWLASGWRAAGDDDPRRRAKGIGLVAATCGFGLHNALDFGWYVTAVTCTLAMLGALAAPPAEQPEPVPRRGLLWSFVPLLLMLLLSRGESHRAAGQAAIGRGWGGTAEQELRAALSTVPWSAAAAEELAGLEASRGRREDAEAHYRLAIRRHTTSARLHYRYAASLEQWGDRDAALRESAIGVALSPLHLQGYLQAGGLLEQAGRIAAARQVYRRMDALARRPELAEAKPIKGYLFEPTHSYGLMRLGELALGAGNTTEAMDAFTRALPDLEEYEATYAHQEDLTEDLPPDERAELLAGQGLHPAERAEANRLIDRAHEALHQLGAE